ncbi:MAG TPA: hypothetical protein VLT79_03270 [Gemmatimonadales bacterium]|nr:hypothetical protein [Gemmatimonadales bacterium]
MIRKALFGPLLVSLTVACSHAPPEDFTPDPGLIARIRDIDIRTVQAQACPGGQVQASYDAVLDDGTHLPFVHSYDKKHPPRLHMVFLDLSSPDASPNRDGSWTTVSNPVATVSTGFRLTATLRAKPTIQHTISLAPDYSCMPHAFAFNGEPGHATQAGGNGPDVVVRLGIARSPFYDRLLVVGIEAGTALPVYALYDGNSIPPADFLVVESRGGRGGAGSPGTRGGNGVDGVVGCPGQAGAPGGDGGNGGPGAPGGRGGRITIVVPDAEPLLAGLVEVRSPGGSGGPGGPGGSPGTGGRGGPGAATRDGTHCADGQDGPDGRKGVQGPTGSEGPHGPRHNIVTVAARDVFGGELPPDLAELFAQSRRRPPRP